MNAIFGNDSLLLLVTIGIAILAISDIYHGHFQSAFNYLLIWFGIFTTIRLGSSLGEAARKLISMIEETHRIAKELEIDMLARRAQQAEQDESP